MATETSRRRRWLEHGIGLVIGLVILGLFEHKYRLKEQGLQSIPVFQPAGIKYAYAQPPEPGFIRGYVHGMAPPPRRPGVKRIVAVGDSITFGLGVDRAAAWPAALERAVPGTEVLNLAICGWDAEHVVSLITKVLPAWQPDLVIWGRFPNDPNLTYLMWGAAENVPVYIGTSIPDEVEILPEGISLALMRFSAMFRQYQAGRLAIAQKDGLQLGADMPWYEEQLARLKRSQEAGGVPVKVLAIPAHTQAAPTRCQEVWPAHDCQMQTQRYRTLIEALGRSGLDWVDGQKIYAATGRPHFMVRPGESAGQGAWENDAEHPTAAGHTALAAGLVEVVQATVGR